MVGWVLGDEEGTLAYGWKLHPHCSNNESEYQGVLQGLTYIAKTFAGVPNTVAIRGDSQLVIRQLQGRYRVKAPNLKPLCKLAMDKITALRTQGHAVTLEHVYRKDNEVADYLSNLPLKRERNGHVDVTAQERVLAGDYGVVDNTWLEQHSH